MMKILYDTQCFDMQTFGGISRYFSELIKFEQGINNLVFPYEYSKNHYLLENTKLNINEFMNDFQHFLPSFSFRGKWRLFQIRNHILNIKEPKIENREKTIELLKKQDFDVFHPTYYDPYFLDYIGDKPFVLTIHDMIHEKYSEFCPAASEIKNKALLAKKASKIIAISESTRNDIIDFYGEEYSKKTEIIYHGSSLCNSSTTITNFHEKYGKYILFTGLRLAYKNFFSFVLSAKDFLITNKINLVCSGSSFTSEEKEFFEHIGLSNNVFNHFATDKEMFSLYNQAECFVFPSYYEGFGIPILEAFECKVPCLLADASCFREIGGSACIYFEPKSKRSIEKALYSILNPENRIKMIEAGTKRLQSFSWEKTADLTNKVYQSIL